MANQVDSVWKRVPDLHSKVVELSAAGMRGQPLAAEISRIAGQHLTSNAIWSHVRRCNGSCHIDTRSVTERLTEPEGGYAASVVAPQLHKHPQGWEPHVEERGNTATAVSQPLAEANPDERKLIEGWNLNPDEWRIVGSVNCRRWQSNTPVIEEGKTVGYEQVWLYYYKANLERVDPVRESEFAALLEEVKTHVFIPGPRAEGEHSFVATLADAQMGKGDQGGAEATAQRIEACIAELPRRVADLRMIGRKMGTLYFFGMGDLIENCANHYAQQTYRTEKNLRDQVNIMRRLVMAAIRTWAPLFDRVVVAAVPGNHGENRQDGKSFTDFGDNHDLAIFDQVQDAARMSAAYDHVSFLIPKDEPWLTLDVSGVITGITHGHVIKTVRATASKRTQEASTVAKRVIDWWAQMAHGKQPIGDATLMFTAHYHHLLVTETGTKTHFQCPALEDGSDWWRFQTGQDARPGILTARVGRNVSEAGWGDLEVL